MHGDISTIILCFIVGTIIGSFLSVVAYRFPMGVYEPVREDLPLVDTPLSIFSPRRSFCPRCKKQLLWHHNIPLISWLVLRGKCAFCSGRIPFRYFLTELVTGLFGVLCYLRFGISPAAVVAFAIVCSFIVMWIIDLDYMILPDAMNYPGTLLGLSLGLASSYLTWPGVLPLGAPFVSSISESLFGIAAGAGSLLFMWALYYLIRRREGLGLGDIKLLAFIGAFFGYECALLTIFVGSVLGSIIGLTLTLLRRHQFGAYISFGPYLMAGAILYIFQFGDLALYLRSAQSSTVWRMFQ